MLPHEAPKAITTLHSNQLVTALKPLLPDNADNKHAAERKQSQETQYV